MGKAGIRQKYRFNAAAQKTNNNSFFMMMKLPTALKKGQNITQMVD